MIKLPNFKCEQSGANMIKFNCPIAHYKNLTSDNERFSQLRFEPMNYNGELYWWPEDVEENRQMIRIVEALAVQEIRKSFTKMPLDSTQEMFDRWCEWSTTNSMIISMRMYQKINFNNVIGPMNEWLDKMYLPYIIGYTKYKHGVIRIHV